MVDTFPKNDSTITKVKDNVKNVIMHEPNSLFRHFKDEQFHEKTIKQDRITVESKGGRGELYGESYNIQQLLLFNLTVVIIKLSSPQHNIKMI